VTERPVLTVRQAPDDKLREHCEHAFRSMMASRKDKDSDAYDIAGLCMPQRSKQIVENAKAYVGENGKATYRNASRQSNLFDGHSIRSFEICANGMLSGLSSRSRPWFKPELEDEDLMKYHPVKVWLDTVAAIMYAAFASSNFYEAALSVYLEMTAFGTSANILQGDRQSISVNHPLTFGEFGISTAENGRPNGLARSFTMTAKQMVGTFVADRFDKQALDWTRVTPAVKEAWSGGHYGRSFVINQLVEENPAYVPGKIGKVGMPWRSLKWETGQTDKKKFLSIEGYHDQCFMAPRWESLAGEDWGTGRGKKALPDMRALQLAAKRSGQAEDMAVKPPTWGPPTIDRVSITNMDGVQPRNVEELVRRHEEQLSQLGPVTDRANVEFLQVAFNRMFGILSRLGLLPPAPEEIQGMEIKVDFVSVLAQAQKLLGLSQTERAVAFVGNIAAVNPEAVDNLDVDAIIADYWDRSGAIAAGLRDPRVRDQIRASRAQQKNAERMAAMMPAAKDGADAARLLSEADTGSGSLLQRMTG
jgi:hypothetical protein